MRNPIRFLAICSCLVFTQLIANAQVCGTDEHHEYMMRTSPQYKTRHLENMAVLKERAKQERLNPRQSPPVYTIPVVVHIIHLGESIGSGTNIPDAQVLDALDGLNARYANENGMGTDIEINFCLANRDPNGCPTSGINRVDGSGVANYASDGIAWGDGCGANEFEIKALIGWPVDQYYNIWVVRDICGDIAGYAYYPNGDWYDGTVIDIASMNSVSRTLAHELGHGLNLQHTFSGDEDGTVCPNNFDCLEDGDEICDTPPHKRNDCGINIPCGASGEWEDSRFNWMSYCPTEADMGRFTEDQRDRMRNTMLEWPRNSLPTSLACSNEENMRITNDNSLMCSGETRELTATPAGGFFAVSSGPGQINGNILTVTGGGVVVVEYIVSQQECTSSVFQAISTKQAVTSVLQAPELICIGQPALLTGIPSGGTFTVVEGPATIDSNTVIATGEGAIALHYEVFRLGCWSSDDTDVSAIEQPEVEIEFLTNDILVAVPETGEFQWLRCDSVVEEIPGATSPEFTATTSGTYAVINRQGGCVDTSACVLVEVTSVEPGLSEVNVRLYPNPVNDLLYLEYDGVMPIQSLIISDMQGKLIRIQQTSQQNKTSVDVTSLAAGVYILTMDMGEKGVYNYRFVKS